MTTDYPAAPGYKPTTDQMLALWVGSRFLTNGVERIEMEVGFYEWISDTLRADLLNLRDAIAAEMSGPQDYSTYLTGLRVALKHIDSLIETL
jgi:hypothetical protein